MTANSAKQAQLCGGNKNIFNSTSDAESRYKDNIASNAGTNLWVFCVMLDFVTLVQRMQEELRGAFGVMLQSMSQAYWHRVVSKLDVFSHG